MYSSGYIDSGYIESETAKREKVSCFSSTSDNEVQGYYRTTHSNATYTNACSALARS